MSTEFDRVEPGQIVTSELMNYVLAKLRDHEQQLSELQSGSSGSGVTIREIIPRDQEAVGRPLELRGDNFLFPPDSNVVTIGGVRVTSFLSSTPTFLRFIIPAIPGTLPQNVEIRVENTNGTVIRGYRVTPAVPVPGTPPVITNVTRVGGSATLQVGAPFIITGANFAAVPNNNVIRIRSRVAGFESEIYDVTNIDTNPTQTNETQIRATLPTNIIIHDPDNGDLMQLSLTVGAHNPAERGVMVNAAV